MGSGYSKTLAGGRQETVLGKQIITTASSHPAPWSHTSLLSFLLLPHSFSVLKTSSSIPRAFLVCKMIALACLNSKGLSSTAFLLRPFPGFTIGFTTALSPAPTSHHPILSPATRKLIKGEMGGEPENMAFTSSLRMFDLREVSKQ